MKKVKNNKREPLDTLTEKPGKNAFIQRWFQGCMLWDSISLSSGSRQKNKTNPSNTLFRKEILWWRASLCWHPGEEKEGKGRDRELKYTDQNKDWKQRSAGANATIPTRKLSGTHYPIYSNGKKQPTNKKSHSHFLSNVYSPETCLWHPFYM